MTATWETVTIASRAYPEDYNADGHIVLTDGRCLDVAADPRCRNVAVKYDSHGQAVEHRQALERWNTMCRYTEPGHRARRLLIEGGRLVATGYPTARFHPVDMTILAALGHDVEAAKAAHLAEASWVTAGYEYSDPVMPAGFAVETPSHFTATFEIDAHVIYGHGELIVRGQAIPQTLETVLPGMRLSRLIAIPGLETLDPVIVGIRQAPNPFSNVAQIFVELIDDDGWVTLE